jgi:malate dehydrogenase (oxaloacetate-decarboxylating)(NADP+)
MYVTVVSKEVLKLIDKKLQGRVIFSSGSPFPPVSYKGTTFYPGQGNNAYIFPGVALGVILARIHHIKEELFLLAAQAVADHVTDADIKKGSLYPPLSSIRECSIDIATKILTYSYENGKYGLTVLVKVRCNLLLQE